MNTFICIILLISSSFVKNINAQITFERLESVPEEFVERYNEEYHEYNPLHVGDLWQYYFDDHVGYVNTRVVSDSIINGKKYFKKISYWHDLGADISDFISWERNDTLSGCSYMLDFEDVDEDGDTLDELPLDSLELPDFSNYTSYKYSYKTEIGIYPFPGPRTVHIYRTFWAIIWGDTVLSKNVEYFELFLSEYIADKFGTTEFWSESPSRYLTGAIINGKTYGTIVDVKEENEKSQPGNFILNNYPNPFNGQTIVHYFLAVSSYISVTIYDILGKEIKQLYKGEESAQYHYKTWTPGDESSGIYFVVLRTKETQLTNKIIYLK